VTSEGKLVDEDISELKVRSARLKFLLIVSLVGFPMLSAWFLYYQAPGLITLDRTNMGELIAPPLQFGELMSDSDDVLAGKWGLLIPGTGHCNEDCMETLYYCRQVHAALGKNIQRVNRFYMVADTHLDTELEELISNEYTQMKVLHLERNRLQSVFGPNWDRDTRVYIVDPLGNIMMVYTREQLGKPMLKDLKHLLKASNLG
jgi:hypothetical protein